MGRLVVSEFVTVDGVMHEPMWSLDYFSDDMGDFKNAELFAADALLLGRVTYESFAAAWPGRTDEDGYADYINAMTKYVVSNTLATAEWNNTAIIRDRLVEQIQTIKSVPGKDLLVFGSADLLELLIAHDLVDEYRLQVFPLVVGQGRRVFPDGHTAKLKLLNSRSMKSGVVVLTYEPDRSL